MLTDLKCKEAKPGLKTYTMSDGNGLILEIRPSGKKYWISRIWQKGKESRRSLGNYPDLSPKQARLKNIELRNRPVPTADDMFWAVYREWLDVRVYGHLSPGYIRTIILRFNKYILPALAKTPMSEITSANVLSICREIEKAGFTETSHRIKNLIGQVCRYAISTGRIEIDPTSALHGALSTAKNRHYAIMTDKEDISHLLKSCDAYRGVIVRYALLFSLYTFCRPGEIRKAEWINIDFDKGEWKIPADKMKMKRPHIVPLASQVVDLLNKLHLLTGDMPYLFPNARRNGRCISDNTVRIALRTMGFEKKDITPHGFRAMASTVLNEHGWDPDVIERQLAHVQGNSIRAAYNHAQYMDTRREMMQWWADWLGELL